LACQDNYLKVERKASAATINTVYQQEQERERIQSSLDEGLLASLPESERKRQL
jgi:hypothetical protein